MKFDNILPMLEYQLQTELHNLNWCLRVDTFASVAKKIEELQAAILLLKQKQNEDMQPQLSNAHCFTQVGK